MTKSLKDYIKWAQDGGVALGHFNISDSEGFRAVVDTSKKLGLPVIVGVSEGERDFIGLEGIVAMVRAEREKGVPVFLNADHTYSVERSRQAIDAGFDAVIIDGAAKSYEENVSMTKAVVEYAKGKHAIVEAELGFIGQSSKILDVVPDGVSEETQTRVDDAARFVEETGVDLFAPSVGNIHGMVKSGEPKLNTRRIKEISSALSVPLVLHGASGNTDEDIREAIYAGVRIVHINTELRVAYKEGIEEGMKGDEIAPYKFMKRGVDEMKKVIEEKLKLFNNM
jgi:fructose-bisphosphate aldolase, class II